MPNVTPETLEAIVGIINSNAKVSISRDSQCVLALRDMLIAQGLVNQTSLYDCEVCDA